MTKTESLRNALSDNKPHTAMELASICGFDPKCVYALLQTDINKNNIVVSDTKPRTFKLISRQEQTKVSIVEKNLSVNTEHPYSHDSKSPTADTQEVEQNDNQWNISECHELIADYNSWARRTATLSNRSEAAYLYTHIAELAIAAAQALNE